MFRRAPLIILRLSLSDKWWSVQAQVIVVDPLCRARLLVVQVHLSRRSVQVDRLVKNPVRRLVDPIDGVDNVNAT